MVDQRLERKLFTGLSPEPRVQTLTYRTGRLLLHTDPLEPLRLFTLKQLSERQGGKLWGAGLELSPVGVQLLLQAEHLGGSPVHGGAQRGDLPRRLLQPRLRLPGAARQPLDLPGQLGAQCGQAVHLNPDALELVALPAQRGLQLAQLLQGHAGLPHLRQAGPHLRVERQHLGGQLRCLELLRCRQGHAHLFLGQRVGILQGVQPGLQALRHVLLQSDGQGGGRVNAATQGDRHCD
ncbi:hypothetical protein EYF80_016287 [Liparis tanakae]|uniref:Uncharacterized protein n=1 Tax=Liparis tanakae TaxID=230148 RepID=A0A4Z2I638_9TELE|nr:hypothetical protein EYF80_016287 [Liparis tanakae]